MDGMQAPLDGTWAPLPPQAPSFRGSNELPLQPPLAHPPAVPSGARGRGEPGAAISHSQLISSPARGLFFYPSFNSVTQADSYSVYGAGDRPALPYSPCKSPGVSALPSLSSRPDKYSFYLGIFHLSSLSLSLQLIPLISFISLGMGSAVLYLLRLALYSPDVRYAAGGAPSPFEGISSGQGSVQLQAHLGTSGGCVKRPPLPLFSG